MKHLFIIVCQRLHVPSIQQPCCVSVANILVLCEACPIPAPVRPKSSVQMQAHYMARLLTQHGLELPRLESLQQASGIQERSSVSMPNGRETDAPAVSSMRSPSGDLKSAEVLPSCHKSQDDADVSYGASRL